MPCFHCERAFEGVVTGPGLADFVDIEVPLTRSMGASGFRLAPSGRGTWRMCGRCGVVFFPKSEPDFVGPARLEGHDAMAAILWALVRMKELRRAGEPARFRVSWADDGGVRTYRLDIRRSTGVIERPSWFKPRDDEQSVEEPP